MITKDEFLTREEIIAYKKSFKKENLISFNKAKKILNDNLPDTAW